MLILICVVLALVAVGFVLVVRDQDVPALPAENPELKHLQERRAVLFENLKDLQFEYLQGKLSDGDYQSLKLGFQNDLAVVLASIDMLKQKHSETSQPSGNTPSSAKPQPPAEQQSKLTCPSCDASNVPGQRFCGSCGSPLV